MMSGSFRAILVLCAVLGAAGCATTSGQHVEPYRDVSCFGHARVSLAEAIAAAERARGATVVDAEYNCEQEMGCLAGNPGGYDVTFFADGRLSRVRVCPETGRVDPPPRASLRDVLDLDFLFDWPESEMLKAGPAAAAASMSMRDAVAAAETRGGKAMAAHVRSGPGGPSYVIELVEQSRVRLVAVDMQDGTLRE
jgi:hypothetical protein